ncbi:B12-binding domain-containing radical SAM protein [archaeon]|nr:B12-binding domain-containing radical SAM protein [archaeon]
MKVLPIYPKFPKTFWNYQKPIEFVGKKAAMPPTGLATVLSMLPENFDPQKIIDLNTRVLTPEDFDDVDIVFTSSMIVQQESHEKIVKMAHEAGKKVVAGGPFPTTYPDLNGADYIVGGEAEMTLQPFLEDLVAGNARRIYGEADVSKDNVLLTKTGRVDITRTPLPRWDLLNLEDYFSAAIQYSRGCPFDCDFCDITKLFGKESRTKTPEQMTRELDALYSGGFRGSVFIVDDNFIGNRSNVRGLLPELISWQERHNRPFSFFTEASMNLAWDNNADILDGMSEAGFNYVFMGIESADDDVLKGMSKGQNTRMNPLDAVRRIQRAGIEVSGGFIVGSDGEQRDSVEKLYTFIQEAGIPVAMAGLLTAVRGTNLYNRLESEGRIREETTGDNTHGFELNYDPDRSEEEVIGDYKELLGKLYDPKNYFDRCRTLQEHMDVKTSSHQFSLENIVTVGRSIKAQLFAPGGLEYAKYLVGTAIKNPSYLPHAIAEAIKFSHFQEVTQEYLAE